MFLYIFSALLLTNNIICRASLPNTEKESIDKRDHNTAVPINNEENKRLSKAKYLCAHLVTDGAMRLAVAGCALGGIMLERSLSTWVGRKLGVTPPDMLCEDFSIIFASNLVALFVSSALPCYLLYKVPQWTNTYVLELDAPKRTQEQNIVSFIARFFINYPIGTMISEILPMKELEDKGFFDANRQIEAH